MDERAMKLALARQKLKNHQEKKLISHNTEDSEAEAHFEVTLVDEPKNVFVESVPFNNVSISNSSTDLSEQQNNFQVSQNPNVTEVLIANERNLKMQLGGLQSRINQLEGNYTEALTDNNNLKQQIYNLQQELKSVQEKYLRASEELLLKESIISELSEKYSSIISLNNNLQDQLEFTKSLVNSKESENTSLSKEIHNIQQQLEATQLQLLQLTSESHDQPAKHVNVIPEYDPEVLLQKISNLEAQLKAIRKEKDQINSNCEQYVNQLNERLNVTLSKNQELSNEVQNLSIRENNLIEQISDMEIQIQNFRQNSAQQPIINTNDDKSNELNELQLKYQDLQSYVHNLNLNYEDLQRKLQETEVKAKELDEALVSRKDENISLSKLNADIASDKLAAQRATEQNKKLKKDVQELEEAFVKISQDKLELTEKLVAEKYLNKELTIKLAEIEEKAKELHKKLHAKDDEMIRLQNSYRVLEHEITINNKTKPDSEKLNKDSEDNGITQTMENSEDDRLPLLDVEKQTENVDKCLLGHGNELISKILMPKEDAMSKLQERFLKIMGEVADLSDEKHRLEHIILQLQNETDTICEYVALYQQQRSLLKKRDEERSAQIIKFQAECDLLKNQLEELSVIIINLAQNAEIAKVLQMEPYHTEMSKVMSLLSNLKNNTLIDPYKSSSELKNFYPCSCCSGKLIDV